MIYKRKGSPYYTCAFYLRGPDGKVLRNEKGYPIKQGICTKTADKAEAKAFERQMQEGIRTLLEKKRIEEFLLGAVEKITGETMPSVGISLASAWEKVAADPSQVNRTARTMESKAKAWSRFMEWIGTAYPDATRLNDITPQIAKAYMGTFAGKSGSTRANHQHNLSSIWGMLMVEARMTVNPWERKFQGKVESDYVSYRAFTVEEVKALMKLSEGTFWHYAIAIAFGTGLRFKDVVHLRRDHFQAGTKPDDLYIVLTPAKTKRTRKEVDPYVTMELRGMLAPVMAGCPGDIFPAAVKAYKASPQNMSREFAALLEKAKIHADNQGKIGFHSLRATHITEADKGGVRREVIMGTVGHGSPSMTKRYNKNRGSSRVLETALPKLLDG
jgi:integrase